VVLGICTSPKHEPGKKGFPPKISNQKRRMVRDCVWLALCAVGAWARARVPGTLLRARCVRKGCMHRHIVRGGCWGTRDCPQHTHCGWWVLGQERVFSALGQAGARAASARVARELAANASIACRAMALQSALSLTPVCWAGKCDLKQIRTREGSAQVRGRSVRDRAWLALRSVGAGARARVPGTHARMSPAPFCARCVRKCSRHSRRPPGQANPHWALDKQVRAMQSHVFVNIIPLH
jgi:hypothetical protein